MLPSVLLFFLSVCIQLFALPDALADDTDDMSSFTNEHYQQALTGNVLILSFLQNEYMGCMTCGRLCCESKGGCVSCGCPETGCKGVQFCTCFLGGAQFLVYFILCMSGTLAAPPCSLSCSYSTIGWFGSMATGVAVMGLGGYCYSKKMCHYRVKHGLLPSHCKNINCCMDLWPNYVMADYLGSNHEAICALSYEIKHYADNWESRSVLLKKIFDRAREPAPFLRANDCFKLIEFALNDKMDRGCYCLRSGNYILHFNYLVGLFLTAAKIDSLDMQYNNHKSQLPVTTQPKPIK